MFNEVCAQALDRVRGVVSGPPPPESAEQEAIDLMLADLPTFVDASQPAWAAEWASRARLAALKEASQVEALRAQQPPPLEAPEAPVQLLYATPAAAGGAVVDPRREPSGSEALAAAAEAAVLLYVPQLAAEQLAVAAAAQWGAPEGGAAQGGQPSGGEVWGSEAGVPEYHASVFAAARPYGPTDMDPETGTWQVPLPNGQMGAWGAPLAELREAAASAGGQGCLRGVSVRRKEDNLCLPLSQVRLAVSRVGHACSLQGADAANAPLEEQEAAAGDATCAAGWQARR